MSFTNQTLNAEYIVKNYKRLEKKVYPVPPAIDKEIARLKLDGMGVSIDTLTTEQKKYLASWEMGTQRAWCGAGALSARSPRMQD